MIGDNTCEAEATADDIRTLVDDETFDKYDRFVKIKADENYRDCPSCGDLILGNRRRPAMTCQNCTAQFCFFHANAPPRESRSEEHTSELQSLMRSSYDVFCLKKQKLQQSNTQTT